MFIIKFTDGRTSEGYRVYTTIIGSVGSMKNTWLIESIDKYILNTGNATHISLVDENDKIVRLYPKGQVMCIEEL